MAVLTTLNAASPLDASNNVYLTFTADLTETLSRALDNVDADFGSMDTLSFNVEYSLTNTVTDDTYALSIAIVNGGTILAAADAGGTPQTVAASVTSTTDANSGATSFTYVNTAANKAAWDAATVNLTQTYAKTKGSDATAIRVDHVIFDGTYTAAAAADEITANGLAVSPKLGQATIGQNHQIVADGIVSGSALGAAQIGQAHQITANGLVSATKLGAASISSGSTADEITANGLASAPKLGQASIGQNHQITANGLASGAKLGAAEIGQVHQITSDGLASEPKVTAAQIGQVHQITANGLAVAVRIGSGPQSGSVPKKKSQVTLGIRMGLG